MEREILMDRGEGATREGHTGEAAMETGEGLGGDVWEQLIVHLQSRLEASETRVEDLEAELAARDVHLFAREAELTVVLRRD